jgi:hypothetical protein
MNIQQIKNLVQSTPNDMELGEKVRDLYNQSINVNEVNIDPNQIDLEDMINEIKNNGK